MSDPISARPAARPGMIGGIAMLFAGLQLILLGGCFLMGVMGIYTRHVMDPLLPTAIDPPVPLLVLPWVLYALAFACFGAAVWLIALGVRWIYATRNP